MKRINWPAVVIVGLIALLLLFSVGIFSAWGMMGTGMMERWGSSSLGWIAMIFMWLIPVGFIVLSVLGIAWLVRNLGGATPPAPGRACPNCGKGVQADWQYCSHCGTSLT